MLLGTLLALLSPAPVLVDGVVSTLVPVEAIVRGKLGTELDQFLAGCRPFGFSGAVLVLVDGKVVLAKGYGLADPESGVACSRDTLFDIGSLTKQFTATAILRLEAQGKLATSDSIAKHLDAVPADKRAITIHHLLTHTSGIAGTITTIGSATQDREEALRKILEAKLATPPGTHFEYSNSGYDLLAIVLEKVSGKSFEAFLEEELFLPAGMKHTGFCQDRALDAKCMSAGYEDEKRIGKAVDGWYSWALRGAGGVITSIDDLARWENALTNRSCLTKEAAKKLFTPNLETYAYGWRVSQDDRRRQRVEHGGTTRGFEAEYLRYPEDKAAVIVLANNRSLGPSIPMVLARIVHGEPFGHSPKIVELDPKRLAACAGKYELARDGQIEIRVEDKGLVLEARGQAAIDALLLQRTDAAQCARIVAAGAEIVAGLRVHDIARVDRCVTQQFPRWASDLCDLWPRRVEQNGAFVSSDILGFRTSSDGSGTCCVALVFEHAREVMVLGWRDGRIDHLDYEAGSRFTKRFMPESETDFVSFDLFSAFSRQRIVFEAKGNAISKATLRAGKDEIELVRRSK